MPKTVEDLSTCEREITVDDIFVIKTHIGHGWRDVIRRLGYSEGQLDQFEENHKDKGIDEVRLFHGIVATLTNSMNS